MKTFRDLVLDPFQRQALEAIRTGQSVVVAAPTGCGKTVIAEYAIQQAIERGERAVYTAPIKALSNQKFRDFTEIYGDRVGIMTGDVTINGNAPIVVMTTEIFRNTIFESPDRLDGIRYVIFDEVHYLDDPDRGTVWEESIIFAPPEIRILCLSATIANLDQFAGWLRKVRPGRVKVVLEKHRPVPLTVQVFNGAEVLDPQEARGSRFPTPREERGRSRRQDRRRGEGGRRGRRRSGMNIGQRNIALVQEIAQLDHLPCIFFIFSRAYVEKAAHACLRIPPLVTQEEETALRARWAELARAFQVDEKHPTARRLAALVARGIAYHHAGLLPTLKEVVERLFTSGMIKLLFATETFALGVNMPARSVAFESLRKFDGVKLDYMTTRAFLQMAGRAGRRGIDEEGFVYANVSPADEDPGDVRRVVSGAVEEITSQFRLSYSTLLSLYSRLGEGIFDACEKSFAYFRHKKKKARYYLEMVELIRGRLQILTEQGYLDGQVLTGKGRFAAHVFGYEIELTQLFTGGLLETLPPPELAVCLSAILFESKRDAWYETLPRNVLRPLMQRSEALLRPFRSREIDLGLPQIKQLDWSLAALVWEWAHGAPFARVMEMTDLAPGDLIRNLRMVLQLLRQLGRPLERIERPASQIQKIRDLLFQTATCIRRDEVDAEHQLRRSLEILAEEGGEAE